MRVLPLLAGILLSATVGCEPCTGVANCPAEAHVSIGGRLVVRESGAPVSGARLAFVRTSGPELANDSVVTTSDADGFFLLSAPTTESGTVRGRLIVKPPTGGGYTVDDFVATTTKVPGDGMDIGRIVAEPYLAFVVELRDRVTKALVLNSTGVFRRTGGVAIQPDTIAVGTDLYGRIHLESRALGAGTLKGELVIFPPAYPRPFYTMPVEFSTEYRDRISPEVTVVHVGSALLWAGEVFRRGSNAYGAGITVDFRRTGGIQATPAQFTTKTDSFGLFAIQPVPASEGELIGDVTIHSPSPFSSVIIRGVRVSTRADDSVRVAGRWGYGAQVFGAVEFWDRTTFERIGGGAHVLFRRTGGARTEVETASTTVNQFGAAGVHLAAIDTGKVVGELEIQRGDPFGTDVMRVELDAKEDDTQRFYGVRLIGRWFPQVAQVIDDETNRPIAGARITYRRTAGVAIAPDPYVVTSNADGYFGIRPRPLSDGDVVGDVTITAPSYRETVLAGIHLTSTRDDTLRFIGAWRIKKP
jgi:hypothetical protein